MLDAEHDPVHGVRSLPLCYVCHNMDVLCSFHRRAVQQCSVAKLYCTMLDCCIDVTLRVVFSTATAPAPPSLAAFPPAVDVHKAQRGRYATHAHTAPSQPKPELARLAWARCARQASVPRHNKSERACVCVCVCVACFEMGQ